MNSDFINDDLLQHSLDRFSFYEWRCYDDENKVMPNTLLKKAGSKIEIDGHKAELELFAKGQRYSRNRHKSLFNGGAMGVIDHDYPTRKDWIRVVFNAVEIVKCFDTIKTQTLLNSLRSYYRRCLPDEIPPQYKGLALAYVHNISFTGEFLIFCNERLEDKPYRLIELLLAELDIFIDKNNIKQLGYMDFQDFYLKSLFYQLHKN